MQEREEEPGTSQVAPGFMIADSQQVGHGRNLVALLG
jgi:hypothetical protein